MLKVVLSEPPFRNQPQSAASAARAIVPQPKQTVFVSATPKRWLAHVESLSPQTRNKASLIPQPRSQRSLAPRNRPLYISIEQYTNQYMAIPYIWYILPPFIYVIIYFFVFIFYWYIYMYIYGHPPNFLYKWALFVILYDEGASPTRRCGSACSGFGGNRLWLRPDVLER